MKKIIKFYKNLTFTQGAVFALTASSVIAIAAPIAGIHVFSPGQTISSGDVNENFDILKTTVEGLSSGQTYVGTYDASSNTAPASGSAPGEYYIITAAGTYNSDAYAVNDWSMWDGSVWDRVPNGSPIQTVFGRTGAITGAEADYTLNLLGDVDLTSATPTNGDVLIFDGSQWRAGPLSDPTVSAFAKTALPSCITNQVLKSNGSTFSCVADDAGTPFSGTPDKVMLTDAGGALAVSSISTSVLGYLSAVTSDIQAQINSKLGSGSFVDWTATGIQTIDPTRINLSVANKVVTTNGTSTVATSSVTTTELGYLTGVTSSINTQFTTLNSLVSGKASNTAPSFITSVQSPFYSSASVGGPSNATYRGSAAGTGLYFPTGTTMTVTSGGVDTMTFKNGLVGVGDTNPTYDFVVAGNTFVSGKMLVSPNDPTNPSIAAELNQTSGIFFPIDQVGISTMGTERVRISNSGNTTMFNISSSNGSTSGDTSVMTLQRTRGTMAIPTTLQSADIVGVIKFAGYNTSGYSPAASIEAITSANFTSTSSPGSLVFKTTSTGTIIPTERVRILDNGYVGIGTSTPGYTLHINGTTGGTTAFTTISDVRFKKDIKRVPNALEKILSLDGVTYNFKTNEFPDLKLSHRREMGVIAQKVEKVFPEAVSKDQKGFRSVAYTMLISPIIEAIRSLDSKQKNLEAENKMLKNYLCTRDPMAPFCEE